MTDTEKVHLIDKIIADFWENNSDEEISKSGSVITCAIASVINFEEVTDAEMQ